MHVPPLVLNAIDDEYGVLVLLDPPKVMLMDQGPFMSFEVSHTSFACAFFVRRASSSSLVRRMRAFGVRRWSCGLFHCLERIEV